MGEMEEVEDTAGNAARILVVCTANVCRSPTGAALLQHHFDQAGVPAQVRSAGIQRVSVPVDPAAVRVCAAWGLDLSGHRPRRFQRDVLADEGRDLIVTMTREHLREVVTTSRATWSRTFTLRELVRRVSADPPSHDLTPGDYWAQLNETRRPSDLMGSDPTDDVADPYGGPFEAVQRCAEELHQLMGIVASLPVWRRVLDAGVIR